MAGFLFSAGQSVYLSFPRADRPTGSDRPVADARTACTDGCSEVRELPFIRVRPDYLDPVQARPILAALWPLKQGKRALSTREVEPFQRGSPSKR